MVRTYSTLCTEHKRNGTPSEGVEHHKQIDANNRERRVAVERLAFNDWVYCLVNADVEHGESLTRPADDERPFAAKLLGSDHETDCCDDDLDDTVDTGGEEASRAAGKTNGLE